MCRSAPMTVNECLSFRAMQRTTSAERSRRPKMRDVFRILAVGLLLAGTVPVRQAEAAGGNRLLPSAQNPQKPETCRPKWPYVLLTCVG